MQIRYGSMFALVVTILLAPSEQASAADPFSLDCTAYNNIGGYDNNCLELNIVATCTKNPAVNAYGEEPCQVYVPATKKTKAIPADTVTGEFTNLPTQSTLEVLLKGNNDLVGNFFGYYQIECSDGSLQISDYCSNYPNGTDEGGKKYNWCWIENNTVAYNTIACPSGSYSTEAYFELWATDSKTDPGDNF